MQRNGIVDMLQEQVVVSIWAGRLLPYRSSRLLAGRGWISMFVVFLDRTVEGTPYMDPYPQKKDGPKRQSESKRPHDGQRGMIKTPPNPSKNVGDNDC